MVEDDINTTAYDWDDDFMTELTARSSSLIDGTAKTYSWEEIKNAAIKEVKSGDKQ